MAALITWVYWVTTAMAAVLSGPMAAATESSVRGKIELLTKLTSDATTSARIANNGNEQAEAHFEAAKQALRDARNALLSDDLASANAQAASGLNAVSLALKGSRDPRQRQERDRTRYQSLRARVFSFLEAFHRIAVEKGDPAVAPLLDRTYLNQMVSKAEELTASRDYRSAIDIMRDAVAMLERALSAARDQETLVHQLSFSTPEEEYTYEKERNHSYVLLVRVLNDRRDAREGHSDAIRRLQAALRANELERGRAERLFANGDVQAAITVLADGSETLGRLLYSTGLAF